MTELTKVVDDTDRRPHRIPVEAYISADYARAENEKLWPKVWQIACREEDLQNVGDFYTYDILDESIIVVRSAPDMISAYYNVCLHRGRRLTKGCGQAQQFACKFHGWRWGLDGENKFVLDQEDWGEALTPENLRLKRVNVGTWGGYVWVNMDPDCEPLEQYLGVAIELLAPFELHRMRYAWRQWTVIQCNWKTALEAFSESYHVDATHPQIIKWGSIRWWSKAEGKHSWHGTGAPRGGDTAGGAGMASISAKDGQDPRVALAERVSLVWDQMKATTTQTLVDAAARLKDEVPDSASPEEVAAQWLTLAAEADAARGVIWSAVTQEDMAAAGHDWHLFPNAIILPSVNCALGYRARPNGYDPDSCIFEVYALELFPEGQVPKTEWVHVPEISDWTKIPTQDFGNMAEVQRGMKSRGFAGPRPSPIQEVPVTHFHKVLAEYMGSGAPVPIGAAKAD